MIIGFDQLMLLLLVCVFLALLVYMRRQRRIMLEQDAKYSKKLRDTQGKLAEYISDLDSLIVMLVGIHEFGMTATGII